MRIASPPGSSTTSLPKRCRKASRRIYVVLTAPRKSKAQALIQLAFIDYAHGRYSDALARYDQLLGFYQKTHNKLMQALVMNGIGDVYNRQQKLPIALSWYRRALVPAAGAASPVLMLTLGRNLAHFHYERKEYAEAEVYFDGCQKVGPMTSDPSAKILALEWRGFVRRSRVPTKKLR